MTTEYMKRYLAKDKGKAAVARYDKKRKAIHEAAGKKRFTKIIYTKDEAAIVAFIDSLG